MKGESLALKQEPPDVGADPDAFCNASFGEEHTRETNITIFSVVGEPAKRSTCEVK